MNFKELSDEEKALLRKIFQQVERNEDYYWSAPSQGFIADWFLLYWELHNTVLEFFGQEPYDTPLEERKKYEEEKCKDS